MLLLATCLLRRLWHHELDRQQGSGQSNHDRHRLHRRWNRIDSICRRLRPTSGTNVGSFAGGWWPKYNDASLLVQWKPNATHCPLCTLRRRTFRVRQAFRRPRSVRDPFRDRCGYPPKAYRSVGSENVECLAMKRLPRSGHNRWKWAPR